MMKFLSSKRIEKKSLGLITLLLSASWFSVQAQVPGNASNETLNNFALSGSTSNWTAPSLSTVTNYILSIQLN